MQTLFLSDPLDNFKDLAARTKIKEKGLFSSPLGFDYPLTVNLDGLNDLILAVEQDYHLNRLVTPKMHFIHKDPALLASTIKLTEMYLTASSEQNKKAESVKKYALSNLNLI